MATYNKVPPYRPLELDENMWKHMDESKNNEAIKLGPNIKYLWI